MFQHVFLSEYAVHGRLGTDIPAPIRKRRNDFCRRHAGKLCAVQDRKHFLSLFCTQFVWGSWTAGCCPEVFTDHAWSITALPAMKSPNGYAAFPTGSPEGCSFLPGLFYQLYDFTAILGAGQSSSLSPQIASNFFRRISNAAASARAFSLRCSSFSSLLFSFSDSFKAAFRLRAILAIPPFA